MNTLQSGWLTTGPKTKLFEEEFSKYIGVEHAVAVNSCTAALHLGLDAVGMKQSQSVVVPTMTFAATAEVVRYFNGKPLLVDCREEDFNIDVGDAERVILAARGRGESIAAIIPVHYGGQMADVAAVGRLGTQYGLEVIEDAAHCCPAFFRADENAAWEPVGARAEVSCYSFYANKTITTGGEGGMACTNNADVADRMRVMSLHGISKDAWKRFTGEGSWYYEIIAPGFKYNLTDIASAMGLVQLRRADDLHRKRTGLAAGYNERFASIEELITPRTQPNRINSWHLYVLRLRLDRLAINRADFISELKARGITTSVHWTPLHMHPYYRETYGYAPEDFPVAARLSREIVTLPLYPDMTEAEQDYVCNQVIDLVAKNLRKG